jgi:transcriptional regulator with XRE-family HTH domain
MTGLGPDKPETDATMRMFAGRVKRLRMSAGLSQRDLAARCFTTEWHVSKIERGISVPDVLLLGVLAHPLGVPVGDLTDGLAPALRSASMAQILDLVAREPRPTTLRLAEALELPDLYVSQTLNYLRSFGEVGGGRHGWEPAAQHEKTTQL